MKKTFNTAGQAGAKLWERIGTQSKAAFLAAFITGVLVYLFALTHQVFCTGDALNNYVFNGDLSWMGRWLCKWFSALGTAYNMPAVNGLLMILAVSLTAGLTVSVLGIRSTACAAVAGAVLMCHPAVGTTLQYLHNADAYMFAALLAVGGLWLVERRRFGVFSGAVLLCLSMGVYQAYLPLVIALMLVRGVRLIVDEDVRDATLLSCFLRYLLTVLLGVGLYYGTTKVLQAFGMQLSQYQAVSSMGRFTLGQAFENFIGCYRDFKQSITFLSFRPGWYVNGYLNYALFAAGWGMMWLFCCMGKARPHCNRPLRLVLLAVLTLLSPLLYCSIRMANPQYVHQLMTYSTVGMYLMALVGWDLAEQRLDSRPLHGRVIENEEADGEQANLLDAEVFRAMKRGVPMMEAIARRKAEKEKENTPLGRLWNWLKRAYTWAVPAALAVCILVWSVGSNLDFYRGHEDYQNLYAQCSNYLALAEGTEGYEKHMPIYVVGQPGEDSPLSRTRPELHEIKSYYGFMVHVLKVQMPYGIANEIDEAALQRAATDAFEQMPAYPLPGCAAVIDDAMIIKLGNVGE